MEGNEESAAFEGDNAAVAACDEEASRESSCAQFEQDELAALRQVTKNGAPPPLSLSSCEVLQRLSECPVLVVGAGGIGCEVLALLCQCGFRKIQVLDLDIVAVSNLHRQFLFRDEHVGLAKAQVAADSIARRFGHLGVDVRALRFLSALSPLHLDAWSTVLVGLARGSNLTREAKKNLQRRQCRVRLRAEYCLTVLWGKLHGDRRIDLDKPSDFAWLCEAVQDRAKKFHIDGASPSRIAAIAKRIVPAIGTTNAVIASLLVQEAFRYTTLCCCGEADRKDSLENYLTYSGEVGAYFEPLVFDKNPNCLVCGTTSLRMDICSSWTLAEFVDSLRKSLSFKKPTVRGTEEFLVVWNPPSLYEQHAWKLQKTMRELLSLGFFSEQEPLVVTDPSFPTAVQVCILLRDEPLCGQTAVSRAQ